MARACAGAHQQERERERERESLFRRGRSSGRLPDGWMDGCDTSLGGLISTYMTDHAW